MEIDRERLHRAVALSRTSAVAKIKNARVIPHWIGMRDLFWYRRELVEGVEFVVVDATSGEKRVVFDHTAVATVLSAASGTQVDGRHLEVTNIDLRSDGVTVLNLTAAGRTFACTCSPEPVCSETHATAPAQDSIGSPDGRWAVFVRNNNLWLRDTSSQRETALTDDGIADFAYATPPDSWQSRHIQRTRSGVTPAPFMVSWSPDSKRLIAPRFDQRHVAPYPFIENVPLDGSFRPKQHEVRMALAGERPEEAHWQVFDVVAGSRTPIIYPGDALRDDPGARNVMRTWWKSEGSSFLQLAHTGDLRRGFLYEIDAATGLARVVLQETVASGTGLNMFNAGGYGPPCVRAFNDNREVLLYSTRGGWGHLSLYDVPTGQVVGQVTDGPWLVRDILRLDEANRRLYFTACGREGGNPYHRSVYRIGLDGSDLQRLTRDAGDHMLTDPLGGHDVDGTPAYDAFSPSGRYFVCDVSTVSEPTRSQILRSDTGDVIATFEHADATALFAAGYRPPEEIVVKSADGAFDLHGLVYRPSDHDPGKAYPLIDIQYASPSMAVTPRSFFSAATFPIDFCPPAATAELGFVVVVVDGRGTPFRSESFSTALPGFLATMGLDDHVAFIRHVAEKVCRIDKDRVGISGVSFGGWASIRALLEYPDVFSVAVAGAPPGGFHSMYHAPGLTALEGPATYEDGSLIRPTPTAIPSNFARFDSARQLDRLEGRLLIVAGEHDENVLPGSTLQFFDAAMKANADVDLLYVPNASHVGFYTPYVCRKVWEYFLRELSDTTLPRRTFVPGMG